MLRRSWLSALVFVALSFSSPAQQVDASRTGGPTPLDAPWRLHFGDDPAYAQPGFDDSHWTLHRIDKDWASAGHKGYAGYAWYRMRVTLPKGNEPLAIAIYPPANAVEVYVDGTLAGTIGRMNPNPDWTFLRDVYAIAVPAAFNGCSVEIALRAWEPAVWAFSVRAGAAAHAGLLGTVGDVERLVGLEQQNRWVANIPDWAVHMLGFAVGLFSLGLFVLQRHAREYAYAAVFFCGNAAVNLYYWIGQQTGASYLILVPLSCCTAVLLCLWLLFIWKFLRIRTDRLLAACMAATLTGPIISLFLNMGVISDPEYSWAYAAMNFFLAVAIFVRLSGLARRGNRDAQLFLIPFSLWALVNCVWGIFLALWSSGLANLFGALALYHGSHFDITWMNVFGLLSNLSVGAVLVLRYARSAKQEQRLRGEVEAARTVQQILVPEEIPTIPGFDIDAVYHPAGEVGGDFYQVLPIPNGGLLAVIGDVS
ncbi:MAG: hypothetical protein JOZ33_14040, partial [Acidobacteriaceae bacterium]|nr:hypothetical protein [Acidobacteriaceae bacterium]